MCFVNALIYFMTEETEIIKLVKAIHKATKSVGIKSLISKVNELNIGKPSSEVYDEIVSATLKKYGIQSEIELHKKYVSAKAKNARTTCILLAIKYTSLSHAEIAYRFKKSHPMVSHALTEYKNMSEKIKEHREFMAIYNQLNEKFSTQ